jgi:hypothetical protein
VSTTPTSSDFEAVQIVFPALQSQSRYVAKRFYRLEEGDSDESDEREDRLQKNNFTTCQHNDYMQSEIVRLARGNVFLKEFFKWCKEQGVNVYSGKFLLLLPFGARS